MQVCKEAVKEAMVSNDRVITLLHKINEKLKHNVDRPIVYHGTTLHTNKLNVMYQECSQNGVEGCARAYFSGPPATIVLCTNRLPSDDQVVEAFTHELIHAYDVGSTTIHVLLMEIVHCSWYGHYTRYCFSVQVSCTSLTCHFHG